MELSVLSYFVPLICIVLCTKILDPNIFVFCSFDKIDNNSSLSGGVKFLGKLELLV
jgi:hypothetical protein